MHVDTAYLQVSVKADLFMKITACLGCYRVF